MNPTAQSTKVPEKDLIDRIAEALPLDVQADYYRELRHCRSLPENDEMLRILRAMQFLTLLIHDAPTRMTTERTQMDRSLAGCIAALKAIENRLDQLPEGVASSIAPEKIAARINESLRQQFVQTTIPQSAEALAAAAGDIKQSVAAFVVAAREISGKHHSTAIEAREAVNSIAAAICSTTRTAREATTELSRTVAYLNWTSLVVGALSMFVLGFLTRVVLDR